MTVRLGEARIKHAMLACTDHDGLIKRIFADQDLARVQPCKIAGTDESEIKHSSKGYSNRAKRFHTARKGDTCRFDYLGKGRINDGSVHGDLHIKVIDRDIHAQCSPLRVRNPFGPLFFRDDRRPATEPHTSHKPRSEILQRGTTQFSGDAIAALGSREYQAPSKCIQLPFIHCNEKAAACRLDLPCQAFFRLRDHRQLGKSCFQGFMLQAPVGQPCVATRRYKFANFLLAGCSQPSVTLQHQPPLPVLS